MFSVRTLLQTPEGWVFMKLASEFFLSARWSDGWFVNSCLQSSLVPMRTVHNLGYQIPNWARCFGFLHNPSGALEDVSKPCRVVVAETWDTFTLDKFHFELWDVFHIDCRYQSQSRDWHGPVWTDTFCLALLKWLSGVQSGRQGMDSGN